MHKRLIVPLLLIAVPAVCAARLPLTPVALNPMLSEPVRPVGSDHPLFNRIVVEPVAGMPNRVGSWLHPITNPAEFNDAMQQTFRDAHMLAGAGSAPRARLSVTWRLIDAPARIGAGSRASVVIDYELRRIDNGATIFQREIRTESAARGGDASERLKANARAAILTNIASIAVCLQRAAIAPAPQDCTVRLSGSYRL